MGLVIVGTLEAPLVITAVRPQAGRGSARPGKRTTIKLEIRGGVDVMLSLSRQLRGACPGSPRRKCNSGLHGDGYVDQKRSWPALSSSAGGSAVLGLVEPARPAAPASPRLTLILRVAEARLARRPAAPAAIRVGSCGHQRHTRESSSTLR